MCEKGKVFCNDAKKPDLVYESCLSFDTSSIYTYTQLTDKLNRRSQNGNFFRLNKTIVLPPCLKYYTLNNSMLLQSVLGVDFSRVNRNEKQTRRFE